MVVGGWKESLVSVCVHFLTLIHPDKNWTPSFSIITFTLLSKNQYLKNPIIVALSFSVGILLDKCCCCVTSQAQSYGLLISAIFIVAVVGATTGYNINA